jgi:hypothetical protein
MKTLLLLFASVLAFGQTTPAGTVAQSTLSNVVGTAGTLVCTLTNSSPTLPSGVHVMCSISGAAVLTIDSVVPTGTNGMVGSFGSAGNTITWIVNQPAGQTAYAWQMAANGTSRQGTF